MTGKKRRIPFGTRVSHVFETIAAYLVYGFFRLLPLDGASAVGGAVMRRLGPHLRMTRTALRNLDLAYPEKTDAEKRAIMLGMWDNLGRVAAEYPHLRRIRPRVELVGGEHITDNIGRPVLFFGAHIANWEVCPVTARAAGMPLHVVYRKPNNPWVEGLLQYGRAAAAAGQIEKGQGGAREILAVLKNNGAIGILIDQKLNEGIPVPFFGRDAMTAPAIAYFGLRRDIPIHPLRIERLGGAHFRVTIYPRMDIRRSGDIDADAMRVMTDINAMVESWVRARPEQWLWVHRRWPESKGRGE